MLKPPCQIVKTALGEVRKTNERRKMSSVIQSFDNSGLLSAVTGTGSSGTNSSSSEENDHKLVQSNDPLHPANLICELCGIFYQHGWVSGTGGGMSIRKDEHVYIAPSGVQKERMRPEDIFVLRLSDRHKQLRHPVHKPLKQSACTPLFYKAYDLRNAGACVHTHSIHAVMATLLWKGEVWTISHQEMIKGMRVGGTGKAYSYLDTLEIPIIENTPDEEDLQDSLEAAIRKYPNAPAVLVRRHGTYSWGKDWEQAKCQAECLDYLLEVSVKMRQLGLETVGL